MATPAAHPKAVRRQTFQHHRRGRPERLAATITLAANGGILASADDKGASVAEEQDRRSGTWKNADDEWRDRSVAEFKDRVPQGEPALVWAEEPIARGRPTQRGPGRRLRSRAFRAACPGMA